MNREPAFRKPPHPPAATMPEGRRLATELAGLLDEAAADVAAHGCVPPDELADMLVELEREWRGADSSR